MPIPGQADKGGKPQGSVKMHMEIRFGYRPDKIIGELLHIYYDTGKNSG